MSGAVDVREPRCDETSAGVWGPADLAFGGFAEKVRVISGSPTYVTEITVGALCGEEAATSWGCPSRRNAIQDH